MQAPMGRARETVPAISLRRTVSVTDRDRNHKDNRRHPFCAETERGRITQLEANCSGKRVYDRRTSFVYYATAQVHGHILKGENTKEKESGHSANSNCRNYTREIYILTNFNRNSTRAHRSKIKHKFH